MHLTFTSDDSEKDWKVFLARDRRRFHTHEVMDVDSKSPTIADWIDKVLRIRELSLRELTLDVSKSGDMFQDCWIKWLVASSTVCFTSGTLPAVRVVTGNRYDDERMVEFLLWCKEERKKRESAIG
ncbi:MAG: hypothetical protein LQ349_009807 [Xanthoria aureola]|nr:MAG: hypothetical protein LQ349_009807 [Xanthoria aureola]